jgi:ribonuclease J
MLDLPKGSVLINPDEINRTKDDGLVILCTGSQAEPRSSLTRMANDDHNIVRLKNTDTVVFSARVIPGNETGIYRMMDALARKGVTVITTKHQPVHASGHAQREEMKLLLNLTKPRYMVPMHGDFRVRIAHGELAQKVCKSIPMVIDDGDILEFTKGAAKVVGRVQIGRVAIDGRAVGDIDDIQIRDRMRLAASGIIVAFLIVDGRTGDISDGPRLLHHGFLPIGDETDRRLGEAAQYAREQLEQMSAQSRRNLGEVQESLRTSIRRFFRKRADKKPVVVPVVHEL